MTAYGFSGPMTARGTVFDAKEAAQFTGGRMLLMGAGCWLLWLLT